MRMNNRINKCDCPVTNMWLVNGEPCLNICNRLQQPWVQDKAGILNGC